jgi:hypothetical protein
VVWHCKKQNTVESSTFRSEIVATKNAIEFFELLRCKLRMFVVPQIGPADIFCDNEAVTINCSTPESTIKKKHYSIAYQYNREAVASKTVRIAKGDSETNLADLFTKLLAEERRNVLIDKFMYYPVATRVMGGCRYIQKGDQWDNQHQVVGRGR